MTVAALSTAGFSQYIASSSNVSASQKAFQSLQQSLASGNLTAAQSAFNTYPQLSQMLTASISNSSSSQSSSQSGSSQLATDVAAFGSAIGSGELATAESAFATVQGDLKATPSQALTNAESFVAEAVQWVDDLMSFSNTSKAPPTAADSTSSVLNAAYNVGNVDFGGTPNTPDPTTSILDSAYGVGTTGSSTSASGAATSGNSGNGASVNAYA